MRIGAILKAWREYNGYSMKVVAQMIGIPSTSTLFRLESGEDVGGDTLATVAIWLVGRDE